MTGISSGGVFAMLIKSMLILCGFAALAVFSIASASGQEAVRVPGEARAAMIRQVDLRIDEALTKAKAGRAANYLSQRVAVAVGDRAGRAARPETLAVELCSWRHRCPTICRGRLAGDHRNRTELRSRRGRTR